MPFRSNSGSNHARNSIYIALGANQAYKGAGPLETLESALAYMAAEGAPAVAVSRPWRTPAWPDPSEPPFVNAAAEIETELDPHALLALMHQIEARLGRVRTRPNAPRTLDLDLIDYRGQVRAPSVPGGLALPHPRAAERAFVLLPLRQIAPRWRHPATGVEIERLAAALALEDRRACRPAGGVFRAAAQPLKRRPE